MPPQRPPTKPKNQTSMILLFSHSKTMRRVHPRKLKRPKLPFEVILPQPQSAAATTSPDLIPDEAATITATITEVEDEDTNLLEPLPDDLESAQIYEPSPK